MLLRSLDESWAHTPAEVRNSYRSEQVDSLKNSLKSLLELTHEDTTDVIDAMITGKCVSRA